MHNPLSDFKIIIAQVEEFNKISNVVCSVREISENTLKVCTRLAKERQGIAKIFRELGIAHTRYDGCYKDTDIVAKLREILNLPEE